MSTIYNHWSLVHKPNCTCFFFQSPVSLKQMKDNKHKIHLTSLGFEPLIYRFIDLSLIHYSVVTSGNFYCKVWIQTIRYIMINTNLPTLPKESIWVSWWATFVQIKLIDQKKFIKNLFFVLKAPFFKPPWTKFSVCAPLRLNACLEWPVSSTIPSSFDWHSVWCIESTHQCPAQLRETDGHQRAPCSHPLASEAAVSLEDEMLWEADISAVDSSIRLWSLAKWYLKGYLGPHWSL